MRRTSPKTGRQLRWWRRGRGWTTKRAALWFGVSPTAWRKWERRTDRPVPRPLRFRIAELHYQERLLTYVRDQLLELQHGQKVDLAHLVTLLEKGTPDPDPELVAPENSAEVHFREAHVYPDELLEALSIALDKSMQWSDATARVSASPGPASRPATAGRRTAGAPG